jgi:hypothetical protein
LQSAAGVPTPRAAQIKAAEAWIINYAF